MKMAMEPIKKAAGDVFATKARKHGNLASDAVLQLMRRAEPSSLYTAVERAAAAGGVTPSLVKAAEDEAKELNYVDDVPFGAGRALNVDVFAVVLEHLPFSAAVNVRLVCNAWNRAIVTSNHWHMVHTNRVEEKRRRLYERSVVADIPGAAFYFLLHRREQDRFMCDSCFCWVKAQWFKNSLGAVLPVYIGDNPNRDFALSRDEKIVKPPTLYIPDRADPNYIYLCLPCRLDYFKKHPHPPILCNPRHRFSWNSLRKMFPISKPMQRSIRSTFALKPDTEAPIGIIVEKMRQVYGGDPGIAAAIISRRYSGKTPA
ncbi:hypothetical protein BC940DRAFT_290754 [Gongronella butleri]|nr:hypothetical protein BC940DRAFT_290754 [Gongronella butleri]